MSYFSHPTFLEIAGYSIPAWVLFYWIGQVAKAGIVFSEAKRLKLNTRITAIIFILQMPVAEVFSKILFFISHKFFHQNIYTYPSWEGLGRIYLGGQLGRVLTIITTTLVTKQDKQNTFKYFDVFLLGSIVSLLLYRISGLIHHAHIGKITTMPWGFVFQGEVRHETALYSIISLAILFIVAWKIRKKIQVPGFLSLIIISWISSSRFIIDFFRRSDRNMNYRLWDTITINQLVFFFLAVISISIIVYTIRHKKVFKRNDL